MRTIKTMSFIFLFGFFNSGALCQNWAHPKTVPANVTKPKLEDYKSFKDGLPYKVLYRIYNALDSQKVGTTYTYYYSLSSQGRIIAHRFDNTFNIQLYKPLKSYILEKFNNYKWIPSHTIGCARCKQTVLMIYTFIIEPDHKRIDIYLDMNYKGKQERVYSIFLPKKTLLEKNLLPK
jgi:hypothetical protein